MTDLIDLPPELIDQIAWYLVNEDLFSFRRTAKYFEGSSFDCFSTRFFRKKGFLLTTDSINVLQSTARHERLRKIVHHLWFNPDCYTFVEPGSGLGELRYFDSLATLTRCKSDHWCMLYGPTDLAAKLTSAFKRLPNLSVIGMRRSEDHQPWGWKRLQDAIGQDPRVVGPYRAGEQSGLSEPTLLFIAMINAAATANLALQRLYTDAIEIDYISHQTLLQDQYNSACRELLYLEINVYKGCYDRSRPGRVVPNLSQVDYGEGLLRLLKACPKLHEIGFQIFAGPTRSYMLSPSSEETYDALPSTSVDPYEWLQAYPHLALKKVVDNVQLKHLRRVKLEKMTTTPAVLHAFLSPSQACLTSIKLRDIRLLSNERTTLDEPKRPWKSIFEFLRDSCPKLCYILLNRLMYQGGTVCFVEHPPKPIPYRDFQDPNEYPNPAHTGPTDDSFFTKYDHIAIEAVGREEVKEKVEQIVDRHWYQAPLYSYEMDESLWHTDTSDEE